jgi:hypothetical protein
MPSKKKALKTKSSPTSLKGWQQIASFLGQPVNVGSALGEKRNADRAGWTFHYSDPRRLEQLVRS